VVRAGIYVRISSDRDGDQLGVRRQLADCERLAERSVLDGHVGNASGLRERWVDLPLTRQRAIVAAILDHVVVGSGRRGYNRFDPDRLNPVWRI